MDCSCVAGIVLYNPDFNRMLTNIESIYKQVGNLIIFDNGSNNIESIEKQLRVYNNIKLIKSPNNVGIAHALNVIVSEAAKLGYKWVLTLDQDSVCHKNTINMFSKYYSDKSTAIICPYVIDSRRKNEIYVIPEEEITYLDFCITSGSFINVEIWNKIGGFNDWLFIGLVDTEYCKRLRILGYKIIRVNSILLDHELGNLVPSKLANLYLWIGNITRCSSIKKLSYIRAVSPFRAYYGTRNYIYLIKKYKLYTNVFSGIFYLFKSSLTAILRGKNKLKIISAIVNGIKDGIKVKVVPFNVNRNNLIDTDKY